EAELQARVDKRRVRVLTLAPGAAGESLAGFDAIVADLAALDRPAPDPGDPELECDPVPLRPEKVKR
ncbi:MAG TPA: hypothetical protein VF037_04305, partial [Gemmatimonadales bacterium]